MTALRTSDVRRLLIVAVVLNLLAVLCLFAASVWTQRQAGALSLAIGLVASSAGIVISVLRRSDLSGR